MAWAVAITDDHYLGPGLQSGVGRAVAALSLPLPASTLHIPSRNIFWPGAAGTCVDCTYKPGDWHLLIQECRAWQEGGCWHLQPHRMQLLTYNLGVFKPFDHLTAVRAPENDVSRYLTPRHCPENPSFIPAHCACHSSAGNASQSWP